MTLQFKRSKKLEHALKCMRESHIDNDSSYFSAVSTEGSATTGDDDTHDDTNTTESEQPKTMQNNYLTCFSQDKQHTPRDPEAMMKGETGAGNGLGTRGASNDPSEFQLFKTAKPIYARKGDPNIKATTKSGKQSDIVIQFHVHVVSLTASWRRTYLYHQRQKHYFGIPRFEKEASSIFRQKTNSF